MSIIVENLLLQYQNKKIIRVVFYERITSVVYVIEMGKMRWPYLIKEQEIVEDINEGKITILNENSFIRNVIEDELSVAEKEKRDRAWDIVNFIYNQFESESLLFESKYRNQAIQVAIEVYAISYNTIKKYMVRYWQGGKIRNALLPNYHNCGGKGKERKAGNKKRGRPRKLGLGTGINIDDKIKKYFQIGLNRYYYNHRENTLRVVYELIIKDFFTEQSVDRNGNYIPILKDTTKIPTYSQFLYWFHKMNDSKKEIIKRKGTRNYYLNYRTIIGDSTQDAGIGPGTLWQIDSTQFDIYLVSSVDRNLIVGRPTVIIVQDVFSKMIVGMNVTFESFNSYIGTMVALENAMLPKEHFCNQYGISIDKNEWDVACVPQKIFADRGELNGKQIEEAIAGLGITILNAPPYRADYKGVIERAFGQLNITVKPFADGIVESDYLKERGKQDYRLKANLTIQEFTKILIKCVLFYNNYHVIQDYDLDEEMIEQGIEKIPSKIWDFGIKNMKGHLRVLPEQTIKIHLLPTDMASITPRGVRYKNMLYSSNYSLKNNWYQLARLNGNKKIKIWYDPRNLSKIYTLNEEEEFHELSLLDHLTRYENKSIYEIEQMINYENTLNEESKKRELQEKIKLYEDIQNIVSQARRKTETEVDESISNTQRLKGIRRNQREERELLRKLEIDKNLENESSYTMENTQMSIEDELNLFKTIQNLENEEGMK